ncbi:MAG: hypothetical protein IPK75_12615 [Acidobacteria bacterium]|nr:hypothetical protein [Acidobacteriota bacterium]
MTDSEIIEHLIEAQRGLMGAQAQLVAAIEEVNSERPAVVEYGARLETAHLAVAKALEHNTDFTRYARKAAEGLLQRIAPEAPF